MKTKISFCVIKISVSISMFLLLAPATMATPHDGLYFTQYSNVLESIAADLDRSKVTGMRWDIYPRHYCQFDAIRCFYPSSS